MFRIIKKHIFSISIAAVIFYLSTASPPALPKVYIPHLDKAIHIIMYMILAAALTREAGKPAGKRNYFVVIALPILYGGALELVQEYFFPPRTGDWLDFLANTIGVLLGYFMMINIDKWKN